MQRWSIKRFLDRSRVLSASINFISLSPSLIPSPLPRDRSWPNFLHRVRPSVGTSVVTSFESSVSVLLLSSPLNLSMQRTHVGRMAGRQPEGEQGRTRSWGGGNGAAKVCSSEKIKFPASMKRVGLNSSNMNTATRRGCCSACQNYQGKGRFRVMFEKISSLRGWGTGEGMWDLTDELGVEMRLMRGVWSGRLVWYLWSGVTRTRLHCVCPSAAYAAYAATDCGQWREGLCPRRAREWPRLTACIKPRFFSSPTTLTPSRAPFSISHLFIRIQRSKGLQLLRGWGEERTIKLNSILTKYICWLNGDGVLTTLCNLSNASEFLSEL